VEEAEMVKAGIVWDPISLGLLDPEAMECLILLVKSDSARAERILGRRSVVLEERALQLEQIDTGCYSVSKVVVQLAALLDQAYRSLLVELQRVLWTVAYPTVVEMMGRWYHWERLTN
jgi:hypothetical protein